MEGQSSSLFPIGRLSSNATTFSETSKFDVQFASAQAGGMCPNWLYGHVADAMNCGLSSIVCGCRECRGWCNESKRDSGGSSCRSASGLMVTASAIRGQNPPHGPIGCTAAVSQAAGDSGLQREAQSQGKIDFQPLVRSWTLIQSICSTEKRGAGDRISDT
ncbi:unnamed protein product [Clonostachys byssicola]|uniref:Uncharacterized protein n=1 Tax=Clonostachys byssicola TaxID=160290 RepID=A0A9N9XYS9_9HYPO|nr:unnamed protein product [Clonostachys byssicola]